MNDRPGLLRRMDNTGIPSVVARLVAGAYIAYLGYQKIGDPIHFLKLINQYEMIPDGWYLLHNFMVVVLPWLEIVGGLALIVGVLLRGTAILMTALVALFTVVVFLRAMGFVADGTPFMEVAFDCGCGGGPEIIWQKLLKNMGLMVLTLWLCYSNSRRFSCSGFMAPVHPVETELPAGS